MPPALASVAPTAAALAAAIPVALAAALVHGSALAGPPDLITAVAIDPTPDTPRSATSEIPATSSPFPAFLETGPIGDVTAMVTERLAVSGLLRPEGIERLQWRSFDHVRPLPRAPLENDGTRFVVAIDPGHGGSDPGARGPNGLLEKHLTLDIARRVRLFLSELEDVDVVLTRERDHGLSRRSRIAAVRGSGADLFVSLHFNHLPQSEVTLVESFYAGPENIAESRTRQHSDAAGDDPHRRVSGTTSPRTALTHGSARFATLVQRRVFDEVSRHNAAVEDAGVKRDTLFVLTRSRTSGALVELTCLSNAQEADRLTGEGYRDRLAAALADAIRDYRESLETRPLDGTDA